MNTLSSLLNFIGNRIAGYDADLPKAQEVPAIKGDIASIETSPATSNHSVGEYIVYNSQLYKVTADISSGQSLVAGTNISATSAGSEIEAITSLLKKPLLKRVTQQVTVAAQNTWYGSASKDITVSGYTPIGIAGWGAPMIKTSLGSCAIYPEQNLLSISYANVDGTKIESGYYNIYVLYMANINI